jgi:DNA ligase (NAD+)
VIPRIVEVVKSGVVAGSRETISKEGMTTDDDACFSDSPGCRDRFLSRAVYFASKEGIDIAGLGRGRLSKLMDAGLVNDLPSIFRLAQDERDVASLLGVKTAVRIVTSIKSKRPPPFRIVAALGIPAVGPVTSKRLARHFRTLDALLTADEVQIGALPDCSTAARSVRSFFAAPRGNELLLGFRQVGIW